MWTDNSAFFGISCIALGILSVAWFFLRGKKPRAWSNVLGAVGAIVASVIVGGIWLAELVPWVWMVHQLTMKLWILSFVFLGIGVAFAFRRDNALRWRNGLIGLTCLLLNAFSISVFLWYATVSGGGV